MASVSLGAALRQIHRLFLDGNLSAAHDSQLLERFLTSGEADAFEAIVARHGPMVMAVCRALLDDPDDVEDAFQATFLVLVRKARTIRGHDALGGWLHRVAHRVAAQANADGTRRRALRLALSGRATAEPPEAGDDGSIAALHEEVGRLADRYRIPIVLCHLEGLSHLQAAARLRCGEATLRRRLARGRDLLRTRLTRRGIAPAGTLLAALEAGRAEAVLSETSARATASAAASLASGSPVVRTAALALATRVSRAMLAAKVVRTTLALASLAIASAAYASVAGKYDQGERPKSEGAMAAPQRKPKAQTRPVEAAEAETVEVHGRVVGPDGTPRAGARLHLVGGVHGDDDQLVPPPRPVRATTGPDGRFRFRATQNELGKAGANVFGICLGAIADGFGPGWQHIDPEVGGKELELRLNVDDVSVFGRVLDLEGRPVVDAKVVVRGLIAVPDGDVKAWVELLRANQGRENQDLAERVLPRFAPSDSGILPETRTGADGRFRLSGIGRDRIAMIEVGASNILEESHAILTTSDPKFTKVPLPADLSGPGRESSLFGPHPAIVTTPGRTVSGIVRDHDSGKSLPKLRIQSRSYPFNSAQTDDQGRYRLIGAATDKDVSLWVMPEGEPYPRTAWDFDTPGHPGPITADITLTRGVWVSGKVTDRASGRPVSSRIHYHPFRETPSPDRPGSPETAEQSDVLTDANGRFRVVVARAGGVLAIDPMIPGYLSSPKLNPELEARLQDPNRLTSLFGGQKIVVIDPPSGTTPVTIDVSLERGREQKGSLVGPDGRPVAGSLEIGIDGCCGFEEKTVLKTSEFTYRSPKPGMHETLFFIHEAKHLGGSLEVTGLEPGPLRVELRPTGTVVGRLVDANGHPRPDVGLLVHFSRKSRDEESDEDHLNGRITTGRDGRFRIEWLVPGTSYVVEVVPRNGYRGDSLITPSPDPAQFLWTIGPGETQDWGDVMEKKVPSE